MKPRCGFDIKGLLDEKSNQNMKKVMVELEKKEVGVV